MQPPARRHVTERGRVAVVVPRQTYPGAGPVVGRGQGREPGHREGAVGGDGPGAMEMAVALVVYVVADHAETDR